MFKPSRTKIIATLGPASDDAKTIRALLLAGVDLVRLNFSHGTTVDHQRRAELVRKISKELNKEVGILADLQGPKIRITAFKNHEIFLNPNDRFILDLNCSPDAGDNTRVGLAYKNLISDVKVLDSLLLDDGRIVLSVTKITDHEIICEVKIGGKLSDHKGINKLGGGLSAPSITEKDRTDLIIALDLEVDYIAISFPRNEKDVHLARELIQNTGKSAALIAKIERKEAVENIDSIIDAADAVMVARGDLGVEIGEEKVPGVQKKIIHQARYHNKAVITATQMMESMIHSSIPTRAEVSDVANAVLDGTDAVMLSAETASGDHPAKVVETVVKICRGAEEHPLTRSSRHRLERKFHRTDEAIAMATMYTANHLDIKAIVCLTESGSTPLWMSRIRSGIPIYAFTRNLKTQRRMTLFRGVFPIPFDPTQYPRNEVNDHVIQTLKKYELVNSGDHIIITKGDYMGKTGGTNALKIICV